MNRIWISTLIISTAGLAVRAAPETAKQAFPHIQVAAAQAQPEEFLGLFTEQALESAGSDKEERLKETASVVADWKVSKVREEGDHAAVVMKSNSDVREVLLYREQGKWKLGSVASYLVEGADLKTRCGKKSTAAPLRPRTENGPYGTSAFSFTHVTGNAKDCKNRMDLWLCHNQDLHAGAKARIVDLGKKPLRSIKGIPIDVTWVPTVPLESGHSYVIHCRDKRDRDFFVKFKVSSFKSDIAILEWTLLSTGFGAPPTIHEQQPLRTSDRADAFAGLCPKGG